MRGEVKTRRIWLDGGGSDGLKFSTRRARAPPPPPPPWCQEVALSTMRRPDRRLNYAKWNLKFYYGHEIVRDASVSVMRRKGARAFKVA